MNFIRASILRKVMAFPKFSKLPERRRIWPRVCCVKDGKLLGKRKKCEVLCVDGWGEYVCSVVGREKKGQREREREERRKQKRESVLLILELNSGENGF